MFVDVAEHPLKPRRERVQFFVQRMDDEIRRNTGILSDEAVAEFRRARDVYQSILDASE